MANPAIDPRRVFVTATGGYVCLSGTVDAEEIRKLVQEIVEKMPGATGVLNEIIAVPRGRSGGPLGLCL